MPLSQGIKNALFPPQKEWKPDKFKGEKKIFWFPLLNCLGDSKLLCIFWGQMFVILVELLASLGQDLDFSKAFDIVSHNILLGKLRKCELDEWSVKWIENWLNGRT